MPAACMSPAARKARAACPKRRARACGVPRGPPRAAPARSAACHGAATAPLMSPSRCQRGAPTPQAMQAAAPPLALRTPARTGWGQRKLDCLLCGAHPHISAKAPA
eukprot:163101-Chlamydomonas_euryale.AAC.2